MTRSLLIIRICAGAILEILGQTVWRSFGAPVKFKEIKQEAWKDRKPPGMSPSAISPTFEWVIIWRSSEINYNFQRKNKRLVDLIREIYWPHWSPPPQHFSATGKGFGPPQSPPIKENVKLKTTCIILWITLAGQWI